MEWFSKPVSARINNNFHGDTGILMFSPSSLAIQNLFYEKKSKFDSFQSGLHF